MKDEATATDLALLQKFTKAEPPYVEMARVDGKNPSQLLHVFGYKEREEDSSKFILVDRVLEKRVKYFERTDVDRLIRLGGGKLVREAFFHGGVARGEKETQTWKQLGVVLAESIGINGEALRAPGVSSGRAVELMSSPRAANVAGLSGKHKFETTLRNAADRARTRSVDRPSAAERGPSRTADDTGDVEALLADKPKLRKLQYENTLQNAIYQGRDDVEDRPSERGPSRAADDTGDVEALLADKAKLRKLQYENTLQNAMYQGDRPSAAERGVDDSVRTVEDPVGGALLPDVPIKEATSEQMAVDEVQMAIDGALLSVTENEATPLVADADAPPTARTSTFQRAARNVQMMLRVRNALAPGPGGSSVPLWRRETGQKGEQPPDAAQPIVKKRGADTDTDDEIERLLTDAKAKAQDAQRIAGEAKLIATEAKRLSAAASAGGDIGAVAPPLPEMVIWDGNWLIRISFRPVPHVGFAESMSQCHVGSTEVPCRIATVSPPPCTSLDRIIQEN